MEIEIVSRGGVFAQLLRSKLLQPPLLLRQGWSKPASPGVLSTVAHQLLSEASKRRAVLGTTGLGCWIVAIAAKALTDDSAIHVVRMVLSLTGLVLMVTALTLVWRRRSTG
jgi:hypothetical protein